MGRKLQCTLHLYGTAEVLYQMNSLSALTGLESANGYVYFTDFVQSRSTVLKLIPCFSPFTMCCFTAKSSFGVREIDFFQRKLNQKLCSLSASVLMSTLCSEPMCRLYHHKIFHHVLHIFSLQKECDHMSSRKTQPKEWVEWLNPD